MTAHLEQVPGGVVIVCACGFRSERYKSRQLALRKLERHQSKHDRVAA